MKLTPAALGLLKSCPTKDRQLNLPDGPVSMADQGELSAALEYAGAAWHEGAWHLPRMADSLIAPVLTTGEIEKFQCARVLSYGGGLDSFAMLLDALERGEKPDAVIFLDVTDPERVDPGEWPGTYQHIREVVRPLCELEGIPFVWLGTITYPVRGSRSLFDWMWQRGQVPVTGPNRLCTIISKVERFELWMDHTFPGQMVECWIGFEAGEDARAKKDPNAGTVKISKSKRGPLPATRVNRFPLIERGLCRCRCEALCRRLGYPVPRKSACVFCPYGTKGDWQTFARELPDHFAMTVQLEEKKPPTAKNGLKLSIMGFKAIKDRHTGDTVGHKAPTLPEFIRGRYRPKTEPCSICGAAVRATKEAGCGYLP